MQVRVEQKENSVVVGGQTPDLLYHKDAIVITWMKKE